MLSSATLSTDSLERIKVSLGKDEVFCCQAAVTDQTSSSSVDEFRGKWTFGEPFA